LGLEYVEFFAEVELAFGISIPEDEERALCTVGQVYQAVIRRTTGVLPERVLRPDTPEWHRLVNILVAFPGIRPEHISWDTDLYRDLALGG